MEGIILFADDKIHENSNENQFFNELKKEYPVVGVHTLDLALKSTSSIATFGAVILDWQFDSEEDQEIKGLGVTLPSSKMEESFNFLMKNDFYSLIYVYSEKDDIERSQMGIELKEKFKDRIKFSHKDFGDVKGEKDRVLKEIAEWKASQTHLDVPLLWSQSINKLTQRIFSELSSTDKNWMKYIYKSAENDGVSPELFVLDIFQYLLSENLIEDRILLEAINNFSNQEIEGDQDSESVARLFQKLFYTKISKDSPFMTGDILKIDSKTFGVIISPECDIKKIILKKRSFDILKFTSNSFDSCIAFKGENKETYSKYSKAKFGQLVEPQLNELKKIFNQNEQRIHVLPSFPEFTNANSSVLADFSMDVIKLEYNEVLNYDRNFKLNSPFIQQVRQRYIAYFGRVGVPTLPEIVRLHNLK